MHGALLFLHFTLNWENSKNIGLGGPLKLKEKNAVLLGKTDHDKDLIILGNLTDRNSF